MKNFQFLISNFQSRLQKKFSLRSNNKQSPTTYPLCSMPYALRASRGFTLIELLVVMGIFVVLTGILVTTIDPLGQLQKARDSERKGDLSSLQKTLEQYYQDFGKYPAGSNDQIVDFKSNAVIHWGGSWQPYINILPKDPSSDRTYVYVARDDMQAYWIYASLERGDDPSLCNKGMACASIGTNGLFANACGYVCNFVVKSPNVAP